jgi:hypothetical protein
MLADLTANEDATPKLGYSRKVRQPTRVVECQVCLGLNAADDLVRDCDAFDDGAVNGTCPNSRPHSPEKLSGFLERCSRSTTPSCSPATFSIYSCRKLGRVNRVAMKLATVVLGTMIGLLGVTLA